ncbi:MAG: XTP/dITP diphosphohydrolase [Thermodesulfobacteriota bacterium]|nr:XTP/dITP diphosphohydrolase [Thermodesulfobacteriota bacterium]
MTQQIELVIATRNPGKLREIEGFLQGIPVQLFSLSEFDQVPDIAEDGASFTENALKKARIVCAITGRSALADDSGLCVDALDGKPGIYSARYAGEEASDQKNLQKLLEEMKSVPPRARTAHFVCVLALVDPNGQEKIFEGSCTGTIITRSRGNNGFGYDPVFFFEPLGLTFAQMDPVVKSTVSHRGKALRQFAAYMRSAAGMHF